MLFIKLLDGIDKNWSTIEKAKYLYNQIGKNTSYQLKKLQLILGLERESFED